VSLETLEEHRRLWAAKPVLRDVYAVWFDALLAAIAPAADVLELGAGPGFLAAHARARDPDRRWLAADVVPAGWNDLAADATSLPFRAGAFDAITAVDVVHHLARPGGLFEEARRVLRSGGRLAAVEPWVTPLSFPVYRWAHQETCRLGLDPWQPFGRTVTDGKDPFEGDAAVVWSLVRRTPPEQWAELGFEPPRITVINGFAYLPTLGFRRGSLVPRRLVPPLIALDRWTAPLARWTGLRVLAVWRRRD
jgi:SAM-dependent methyltransferase